MAQTPQVPKAASDALAQGRRENNAANKTVLDLQDHLQELQDEYHKNESKLTVSQMREQTKKMNDIRAQMVQTITEGAVPCPTCKNEPHGMMKRQSTDEHPALFEIGCLKCRNTRARGWSREEAVAKWNAGARSDKREGWYQPNPPAQEGARK